MGLPYELLLLLGVRYNGFSFFENQQSGLEKIWKQILNMSFIFFKYVMTKTFFTGEILF